MSYNNLLSALLGEADENKKRAVWNKGRIIPNFDPNVWRWDANGMVMKYSEYGNRNSKHGWELDHYPIPAAFGGGDDISNLRPLHWEGNASHGGSISGFFK